MESARPTNVSDVPRSLQSWVSTIKSVVLTADLLKKKKQYIISVLLSNNTSELFNPSRRRSGFRTRLYVSFLLLIMSLVSAVYFSSSVLHCCTYIYPYSRTKSTRKVDLCCSIVLCSYECTRTYHIIHTSTAETSCLACTCSQHMILGNVNLA